MLHANHINGLTEDQLEPLHIVQKTVTEITTAVRTAIENLYGGAQPKDPEDVWLRYHTACGMLMAWSEICVDMGSTQQTNVAAKDELAELVNRLDNISRRRIGMPLVGQ